MDLNKHIPEFTNAEIERLEADAVPRNNGLGRTWLGKQIDAIKARRRDPDYPLSPYQISCQVGIKKLLEQELSHNDNGNV